MPSGDRCQWPKCRAAPVLQWLGKALCSGHWSKVCELTDAGPGGYARAYEVLRVAKKYRTAADKPAGSRDFGDLPDPDNFDYSA